MTVEGRPRFTCFEGPEFDAHKVDLDDLLLRLQTRKNRNSSEGFCRRSKVQRLI